jgi:hypothetical protein
MAAISAHKKELDDLEKAMETIRRDFDQFFLGTSKRPPTSAQAQLAGLMRKIKEEEIKDWNTQDKFRFNQIHARFVTMERMWARTMKQIEDGTYKRDKFKIAQMKKRDEALAKRNAAAEPTERVRQDSTVDARHTDAMDGFDVDVGGFDDDDFGAPPPPKPVAPAPRPQPAAPRSPPAASPAAPPAQRPAAAAASSGGDLGGLSEARLQQLHKVYVDAKRRTGEQSSLTLDALRQQVAKQVPVIRQKHGCEQVDFKVVLKDGKAMLKAIPK